VSHYSFSITRTLGWDIVKRREMLNITRRTHAYNRTGSAHEQYVNK